MSLARIAREVSGRVYEAGLRLGVARYRLPFQHCNDATWERGYATDEHDHYEGLAERPRYGALVSYLGAIDGPLDILDIGCGTGVLRERISEQKVRSYVGVDMASSAVERAKARGFANSEFIASGIPESGSFDAVICNEMLYFVPDVDALLDTAKRLVRPGGLFLTSNTRFPGDFALREKIAARFEMMDEAVICTVASRRKWRVGCYRVRGKQ